MAGEMTRKGSFLVIFLLLLAVLALSGYWLVHTHTWGRVFSSEGADYARAKELLSQGKIEPATEIISRYKHYVTRSNSQEIDWLPLAVDALLQSGDTAHLAHLYEIYPRVIANDESKALVVAGGLIANRRLEQYEKLRKEWRTKRHNEAAWFVLDADALIVQRKKQEAIVLLESRTFPGPEDSLRLIRLAVYHAPDHLGMSWQFLEQALAKDPDNLNIRRYRAQILEIAQRPALAEHEYTLAILKSPRQPHLYDQLAQFFIRRGQLRLALDTWKKAVALPGSEIARLSVLFWSRVGLPTPVDWQSLPSIQGHLVPLINYLIALPKDRMWDDDAFERVPDHQAYLRTQQETFWLRVIQALLSKKEEAALDLLTHSLFSTQSWSPDLLKALQQILLFRREGKLRTLETPTLDKEAAMVYQHSFFKQLNQATLSTEPLSQDLTILLSGPYAFPAAFLAAGWFQAAMAFGRPSVLDPRLPEWVAYAYTQAIRWIEGPLPALHFANLQGSTPALSLLKAELMLATGSLDAGLLQLEPLRRQATNIGVRATYLATLVLMKEERYDEAKATLDDNPLIGQTLVGKELLARIALAQGDRQHADQIYQEIADQSIEARKYLLNKAMMEGNLSLARQLVERLLIDFPENQEFIDQWQKIRSQGGKGGL